MNGRLLRDVCYGTSGCLYHYHRWTRMAYARDYQGRVVEHDDPRVVRRNAAGWLRVVIREKITDPYLASKAEVLIASRFIEVHGCSIGDMNDDRGRSAVQSALRAVARSYRSH